MISWRGALFRTCNRGKFQTAVTEAETMALESPLDIQVLDKALETSAPCIDGLKMPFITKSWEFFIRALL